MLVLTESVLFFLNLAVKRRSKKLSFDSHVKDWIVNVAREKTSNGVTTGGVGVPLTDDDTFSSPVMTHNLRSSQKCSILAPSPPPSEDQADEIFGDEVDETDEKLASFKHAKSLNATVGQIIY